MSTRRPLDELRRFAEQVCDSRLWVTEANGCPVSVTTTRRDSTTSTANPVTGVIKLASVGLDLATLAHEMAHVAAGPRGAGHSPRFRALEVALVRLLAGDDPAERLSHAFAAAGLPVDDIAECGDEAGPRGLVDPSTSTGGDERLHRAWTIRKLLDRAARTDAPAEAEACQRKAAELMARHRIDELLLASLEGRTDRIVERRVFLGTGPYVQARTRLVEACAHAYGCTVFWRTGTDYNTVYVVGNIDDVNAVLAVHTMLSAHAAASMHAAQSSGNVLAWRRAFLTGYAAAAAERLSAAATRVVTTADAADTASMALVLQARAERVQAYMQENHPSLRSIRPTPPTVRAAIAARPTRPISLSAPGSVPDGGNCHPRPGNGNPAGP